MTDRAVQAARGMTQDAVARLVEFVAIPSISGDRRYERHMDRAAQWLAQEMLASGLQHASVVPTDGPPVVLGSWHGAGPDAPTVLVYCHYDVQPVEPLHEWSSPPFEATQQGDLLYGRGTADDKGPIMEHLTAVRALLQTDGALPVNLIMCVEGEEEVGSTSLPAFLREHREELAPDIVVVSDTTMLGMEHPGPTVSMRGVLALEVSVQTLEQDVHSGKYGGAVLNAAGELARLVSSLHEPSGKVAVQGFYDDVRDPTPTTRASVADVESLVGDWVAPTGAVAPTGESGWSTLERVWLRPTLEVNGLTAGHTGPGSKTIVPARASAKLSARLIDGQEPAVIADLVRRHVQAVAHPAGKVDVTVDHGGAAMSVDADHPFVTMARQAYESGYGRPSRLAREGGSVPVAVDLKHHLQAPVLLLGFGLPTQREHAPDEQLSLTNFTKATATVIHLWRLLGDAEKSNLASTTVLADQPAAERATERNHL